MHKAVFKEAVINLTQSVQTILGIGHHHLRALEGLTLGETVGEVLGMNSQHYPGHIEGGYLYLRKEVSAVNQVKAINLSLILVGIRAKQGNKRVMLRTGTGTV